MNQLDEERMIEEARWLFCAACGMSLHVSGPIPTPDGWLCEACGQEMPTVAPWDAHWYHPSDEDDW